VVARAAYKIPSGSMRPGVVPGDHVFVRKTSAVARGDIVVYPFPEKPEQHFLARVVAMPGEVLETREGHPWINGWQVPSCDLGPYAYRDDGQSHEGELFVEYLEERAYLAFYDRSAFAVPFQGPFTAKPGEIFGAR
jgi:signal peptidase I